MVFGLNATLRHHVSRYCETGTEFVQKVLESFNVDDLVNGESTVKKAFQLYDKTKCKMAQGEFKLRKWLSNSNLLEGEIKVHEQNQDDIQLHSVDDREYYAKLSLAVTGCKSKCHKVLGQVWKNKRDEFKFEIAQVGDKAKALLHTKRNLLSVLASLLDPLGIIRPVIVCAKILFQEVRKDMLNWDENFTEKLLRKWEGWYMDLIGTREITTPCCIYQHPAEDVLE